MLSTATVHQGNMKHCETWTVTRDLFSQSNSAIQLQCTDVHLSFTQAPPQSPYTLVLLR